MGLLLWNEACPRIRSRSGDRGEAGGTVLPMCKAPADLSKQSAVPNAWRSDPQRISSHHWSGVSPTAGYSPAVFRRSAPSLPFTATLSLSPEVPCAYTRAGRPGPSGQSEPGGM